MENRCKSHFLELNQNAASVIEASFQSDERNRIAENYDLINDLSKWVEIIQGKSDVTILKSAIAEYEFSFQAALAGQYRYCFLGQRYFLEQVCRFIFLSTNELYLRHWKMGMKDVSWGSLVDIDNGIFAKIFIRAFFEEVEDEGRHMISMSTKLYRESSEFIHGNYKTITTDARANGFNEGLLSSWLDAIESSKFVALFLLMMRFSKELKKEELAKIEESVRDELGGIEAFTKVLDASE